MRQSNRHVTENCTGVTMNNVHKKDNNGPQKLNYAHMRANNAHARENNGHIPKTCSRNFLPTWQPILGYTAPLQRTLYKHCTIKYDTCIYSPITLHTKSEQLT